MAQKAQKNDQTDPEFKKENRQIREEDFMNPYSTDAEAERPLSPGLVARVTEVDPKKARAQKPEDDANVDRVFRETEQTRINSAPNSTWPG